MKYLINTTKNHEAFSFQGLSLSKKKIEDER
jgi:hypothetical protein